MSTHNVNVHEINSRILEVLAGDMHHLYSVDKLLRDHDDQGDFGVDQDTLNLATTKGVSNHEEEKRFTPDAT